MKIIKKSQNLFFLFVALCILPLILYTVLQTQDFRQRADELPTLYVLPDADTIAKGETIRLAVILDAKQELITAISFSLAYPYDKLLIDRIDDRTSAFPIQAEYIKGSGILKMEREVPVPVSGEQQVIDIIVTATDDTNITELSIPEKVKAFTSKQKNILISSKILSAADGQVEKTEETGITALVSWVLKSIGINE